MALSMPLAEDGGPAAVLKVAGVEHRLNEGQYLLWDDTFEHEAWNNSDEVRIVLSLDIWRERMPIDMKLLSVTLIQLVGFGIRIRGLG
jgi:aspartate beta-hydroxylase